MSLNTIETGNFQQQINRIKAEVNKISEAGGDTAALQEQIEDLETAIGLKADASAIPAAGRLVPTGGTDGQVLKRNAAGAAVWSPDNNTNNTGSTTLLTGYALGTATTAIVAADSVNQALSKLEARLNALPAG